MDHTEALEHIEIAAAEPDGIERLMAGDTPEAAAVAGHLAGCPACVGELARLRRVADIARAAIAEEPAPALKRRTLDYVREVGAVRRVDDDLSNDDDTWAIAASRVATDADSSDGPEILAAPITLAASRVAPGPEALAAPVILPSGDEHGTRLEAPGAIRSDGTPPGRNRSAPLAWLAGIAAALLLVGVVGYGLGAGFGQEPPHDDSPAEVLADATTTALELAAEPGTQVVLLAATPAGGDAAGRLAFNGGSGDLVMVATGLVEPGAGAEYGCWVEADGERRRIGTMYAAGDDLWAWSGAADALAGLPADTVFGVSLVPADGSAAVPVLTGGL